MMQTQVYEQPVKQDDNKYSELYADLQPTYQYRQQEVTQVPKTTSKVAPDIARLEKSPEPVPEAITQNQTMHCTKTPWWFWCLGGIGIGVIVAIAVAVAILKKNEHKLSITCREITLKNTIENLPLSRHGDTVIVECVPGARVVGEWKRYITKCINGTWERTDSCAFTSCEAAYENGLHTSGIYLIAVGNHYKKLDVWCEQQEFGGGWTVFQRRVDGRVNFSRSANDYKVGFGDLSGSFWLGNDNIHELTARSDQKLKIVMTHPNGSTYIADYRLFKVQNEANSYRLQVFGFSSSNPALFDAMAAHSGWQFSTIERDLDGSPGTHCAKKFLSGWWYHRWCASANLNGIYGHNMSGAAICWNHLTCYWDAHETLPTYYGSLTYVTMMVKTSNL